MFGIKSNLNRRSNRYNIYQPQRYAIYVVGKWMGLIGSALLLFSLTIKWYFLLDDNTKSLPNALTWCLIISSVLMFGVGAMFIVGLHWYVEKKYNTTQETSDDAEKTQKHLKEARHQSIRYKERSSWLIWKLRKNLRMNSKKGNQKSNIATSIRPNNNTIYNTNATESSFQVILGENYLSDSTSFSSTKKLVRTNSKFNQPSLPIIDETKQQNINENYMSAPNSTLISNIQGAYISTNTPDVMFDTKNSQDNGKTTKTKHVHKLSTGSGKNYILEAFLKQDHTEDVDSSDQIMNNQFNNQANPIN